jgi:hypothetical protein
VREGCGKRAGRGREGLEGTGRAKGAGRARVRAGAGRLLPQGPESFPSPSRPLPEPFPPPSRPPSAARHGAPLLP